MSVNCAVSKIRMIHIEKSYLLTKFRIGQTTGHRLDAELVSRDVGRARGTDGARLFKLSEFLTISKVASFFSIQSAAVGIPTRLIFKQLRKRLNLAKQKRKL